MARHLENPRPARRRPRIAAWAAKRTPASVTATLAAVVLGTSAATAAFVPEAESRPSTTSEDTVTANAVTETSSVVSAATTELQRARYVADNGDLDDKTRDEITAATDELDELIDDTTATVTDIGLTPETLTTSASPDAAVVLSTATIDDSASVAGSTDATTEADATAKDTSTEDTAAKDTAAKDATAKDTAAKDTAAAEADAAKADTAASEAAKSDAAATDAATTDAVTTVAEQTDEIAAATEDLRSVLDGAPVTAPVAVTTADEIAAEEKAAKEKAAAEKAVEEKKAAKTKAAKEKKAAAAKAAKEKAAAAEREALAAEAASYANGEIPSSALCELDFAAGQMVRCDAAHQLEELNDAYRAEFGSDISVTSSYRSYAAQVSTKAAKGYLAAVPGTSNHGYAVAVDLSIGGYGSAEYGWLRANAPAYGWDNPDWARPGGSKAEPWHWEYGTTS